MMPPMENSILAAQLALFDELRNVIGHPRDSAIDIVQRIAAAELFGHDGLIDDAAVAAVASRHPVTDAPAPDDRGAVLVALCLAHAMVSDDTDVPAALLPTNMADFRTLLAAQAWVVSAALTLTAPGRELEVLSHLHHTEITAITVGAK